MRPLPDVLEDLRDRLPQKREERLKLYIAGPIIVICTLWIVYMVATRIDWRGPVRPPNTAATRLAAEVTAKLLERPEFNDTGVFVASERPLKLTINGAVHYPEDLVALKEFVATLKPGQEFDWEVLVIEP